MMAVSPSGRYADWKYFKPADISILCERAAQACVKYLREKCRFKGWSLYLWNDLPNRTQQDVIDLFEEVAIQLEIRPDVVFAPLVPTSLDIYEIHCLSIEAIPTIELVEYASHSL